MKQPTDPSGPLYVQLMEEVKVRLTSITALTQDQRGIASPLVREFCFLQLRMLCELIALGCLVANGDILARSARDLGTKYKPKEMFDAVEKLHPRFYPSPRTPTRTETGWHFNDYNHHFLSREELVSLWGRCGDILHKGGLKKIINRKPPIQRSFQDVSSWVLKIQGLLNVHQIEHVGHNSGLIIYMNFGDENGVVTVHRYEAITAL
ncbi:hypothetical protein [Rhizobium sp. CECT 9324]|uniref:hypothetical protein n=1 Tax=Rhizobium sp. CECT 9324 TaxID=2845820 RepID=UPI001E537B6A|nr:hypothetical protein [Rhizobium sp. CECT 9324]CAH0339618.1 hypothetical protein RHI9324_01269 [Rhizobium sp. CECT 9324]